MYELKEGDLVTRKSYDNDIIFEIKNFFSLNNNKIAILQGVTIRIEADSPISDLELIRKEYDENNDTNVRMNNQFRNSRLMYTGRILHLDGDKRYSEKASKYYKQVGLNAIVRNIPENRQSWHIVALLDKYNPDILVITGHKRRY